MAVDSAVRGGEACALLRPALHALHTRLGFVCEEGARSRAALAAQAGEVRRLGALNDALTLQAQRMQHKQRDAVAHLLHAQAGAAALRLECARLREEVANLRQQVLLPLSPRA